MARDLPGVVDALFAGQTVALWLADGTDHELVQTRLQSLWQGAQLTQEPPRCLTLPIHYDGEDLHEVAQRCGLSPREVIALHCGVNYRVAWLGFLPGFAYLDGLPEPLQLPRRSTPRVSVPAGSLAIAGSQSALYPCESPGGWHLIGRCNLTLFDPRAEPPSLLLPGDRIRFEPVGVPE
ncbi:5-oxoprolinase subunit PxpB [Ferrimonas sediminicola]|uniref:5-oxoprolinase subunit PxpB n=2 Tax=Ferrimonas sediminicola TaxID=2569538 RepID=A0A4U1BHE6_9GAMM|nr:5-oxoprolinase subunit PxpB [Ferrimonas sediminicola]